MKDRKTPSFDVSGDLGYNNFFLEGFAQLEDVSASYGFQNNCRGMCFSLKELFPNFLNPL